MSLFDTVFPSWVGFAVKPARVNEEYRGSFSIELLRICYCYGMNTIL